jgi:hypothetical protein
MYQPESRKALTNIEDTPWLTCDEFRLSGDGLN